MLVIDASVAVKALLLEPGSDRATALLASEADLAAPSIILAEVLAAITRAHRADRIGAGLAREIAGNWRQLIADGGLVCAPDDLLLEMAVDIALSIRHPLQDCLYLALAQNLDCPLVTADRKLIERGAGAHAKLRLLDEWPG
ncbi:MAG: type II toxin-antitoxin system VapC family toxin [Alphaproteobacteria bacterium]|nr:type II toxin-antitoxin system VapC family toxin [Alphaproteobacteria bacterium]MBU0795854.1 type II toxin-antitoxin system VapC family toxin [Alphaproteobacteria bacterium]MBU0886934.1 type II toxin-antitoxin system VapC family toxin [Alphaproteobacteria bacterium]MBU1813210.1 type II toxin-antitoxin system VapC family toxin [Alphaproteobacteria bacterium]MBU2091203.1 type II toxin-antitoxin system VapC family toxin [Alphaproteobacteria bacterium]